MGSAGLSKTLTYVGMAALAVAAILAAPFTGGASIAGYVTLAGTVLVTAGALLAPGARVQSFSSSRHYGIGNFSNPVDPDTVVPILYGTTRVVPIVLQESVAALAEGAGLGIDAVKKQGINILLAVAEGQVSDITAVRINDQPVVTEPEAAVKIGKGNGTRKEWTLPASYVYLPSLTITVNTVEVAQVTSSYTSYASIPASGKSIGIFSPQGETILTDTVKVYLDGTEEARGGVWGWTLRSTSKRRALVIFKTKPALSTKVKITFDYIGANDLIIRQNGKGKTTLTFGTAVGNGYEIFATYRRANYHGLVIETRPGTLDQSPIPGFGDFRQGDNVGEELTKDAERSHTTKEAVNDIRVGIEAPRGFVVFNKSGGLDIIRANIVVEYQFVSEAGVAGKKRVLYHLGNTDTPKSWFALAGQSASPRIWEIGVRDTLLALSVAGYSKLGDFNVDDDLETMTTGSRMKITVTRKDVVRTDAQAIDGLYFKYVTRITDTQFSYPGTALLAVRALVDGGLNGGTPTITCTATRAKLYDPRTGLWNGRSDNPALAVYDLITSGNATALQRYGGRGWFTSADLDSTTLNAWANFCDETAGGETRHSLNLVMDTPMALSEWVADIAFMGGAFAVMQGVKWRFPLDKTGASTFSFVESTDPANANVVAGSFEMGPEPLEQVATDVEVQFFDRTNEWQPETVLSSRADLAATTPRKTIRVSARGVDRTTEAERLSDRLLLNATNNPVPCTWLAHPGAIAPEAGDIVDMTSYIPGGTAATGWAAQKLRIVGMTREWPVDQRAPLVRYEARAMSEVPYATAASQKAESQTAAPAAGSTPGSASGTRPGSSGPPVSSNGGAFGVPGAGGGSRVGGFKAKLKGTGNR